MKFSIWPHLAGEFRDLIRICEHAESTGWDGIWIADHFMPNTDDNSTISGSTGEAWTTLAALAALIPRVRIGTLVTGNTYRHPAVLAKMAAQVDVISHGRSVLGIGSGWQENEHLAYGMEFSTVGGRLRQLEESIQIIRSLFENERTTFDGRYYQIKDAPLDPKPVQKHLPILVGGGGEKVTLRITAQYADEWNVWGAPDVLRHKGHILEQHCEALGRDAKEIHRTAQSEFYVSDSPANVKEARESGSHRLIAGSRQEIIDLVGQYSESGVDELIIPNFNLGATDQVIETYDFWRKEIISSI